METSTLRYCGGILFLRPAVGERSKSKGAARTRGQRPASLLLALPAGSEVRAEIAASTGNQAQESNSAPRLSRLPSETLTFLSIPTLGPLTALLKSEASWRDEFPAWQVYADECETLLTFAKEYGALGLFWPRLRAKQQQREEALNELRVAYILDLVGYPISEWEPIDVGNAN